MSFFAIPLGRHGQPVISKNGKYIALGNKNKIDIYDQRAKLISSFALPGARPYGNYAVSGISGNSRKIYLRTWNSFLTEGAGGLFEIDTRTGLTKRIDVDGSGNTFTYQGWGFDEEDIDYTKDYSKAVMAIRDTANSTDWGQQRVNIFIKDLISGDIRRIDYKSSTTEMGYSSSPRISNDGAKILFESDLDLTSIGAQGRNIYLWNSNGSFRLINKLNSGSRFTSNYGWDADLSGNGNKVVFQTHAALDEHDTNRLSDVYIKDVRTGRIDRVSTNSEGGIYPRFSNNGKFIYYQVYNMQERYLKVYDVKSKKILDMPGKIPSNVPHFKSESFVSIANDSGIFWTWKD